MRTGRTSSLVLLLVAGLALVTAACGGGDDSGGSGTTGTDGSTDTTESAGDPVLGGTLVFGLEAETPGWDPTTSRFASSGHVVARAIFDPLATWDADGVARPYLAEDLVPNDDFTEWDVVLPTGVTFHDGTPLTADAIVRNFDGHLASALTGPALNPLDTVTAVDETTVRFSMNTPWASFPVLLVGQVGYVAAPSQLDGASPTREPIGTGPFAFESWTPDAELKVTKNESYWRDGLPYLDAVTFRPIPDTDARGSSIKTGDIDAMHTEAPGQIVEFRSAADAGDAEMVEAQGAEILVMLNLDAAPLDDPAVRLILAHATNPEAYVQVIGQGVQEVAKTPFAPESKWHDADAAAAYPAFDQDEARRLLGEWESENGPLSLTLANAARPERRQAAGLVQEQWQAVGIDVAIEEFEQSVFVNNGLAGDYQAYIWRQFGAVDPDGEYVWWTSENAEPPIALNFARNRDPVIDEAMQAGRETPDEPERQTAYAEVQQQLSEDLPYLWLSHTLWALVGGDQVGNLGGFTMVDGSQGLGLWDGQTYLTEVWVDG